MARICQKLSKYLNDNRNSRKKEIQYSTLGKVLGIGFRRLSFCLKSYKPQNITESLTTGVLIHKSGIKKLTSRGWCEIGAIQLFLSFNRFLSLSKRDCFCLSISILSFSVLEISSLRENVI